MVGVAQELRLGNLIPPKKGQHNGRCTEWKKLPWSRHPSHHYFVHFKRPEHLGIELVSYRQINALLSALEV